MLEIPASQKYLKELSTVNQEAANQFFGPRPPLGILRSTTTIFQGAQLQDDIALKFSGTPTSVDAANKRDQERARAIKFYDDFKGFTPDKTERRTRQSA